MKRISLFTLCILLCIALIVPFASCQRDEKQEKSFFLMDTTITVTLYTNPKTAEKIFGDCRQILSEYENLWSRTKEESDVGRFNQVEDSLELDTRTAALIAQAIEFSQKTGGAFDITVAPIVNLWQTSDTSLRAPLPVLASCASTDSRTCLISLSLFCRRVCGNNNNYSGNNAKKELPWERVPGSQRHEIP